MQILQDESCQMGDREVAESSEKPKEHSKTLFGALQVRGPKALKKHSAGHSPARAPGHSCKWWPGSQLQEENERLQSYRVTNLGRN